MENIQNCVSNDDFVPTIVAKEVEVESTDTPDVKPEENKFFDHFESSDYKNGALFDDRNYCWSQTFGEVGELAILFIHWVDINLSLSLLRDSHPITKGDSAWETFIGGDNEL